MSENMTGAELQTLREACGLTREDLAGLVGVAARTVKHWENGRAGVPADVAGVVRGIDSRITSACNEALLSAADVAAHVGGIPADVVLLRYQNAEDLARYQADMASMPAGVYGAMVGRLRLLLPMVAGFSGVVLRVVWMQGEIYEAWRAVHKMPDNETTRSAWAAGQVDAQAQPHRGDQPPGGGMQAP